MKAKISHLRQNHVCAFGFLLCYKNPDPALIWGPPDLYVLSDVCQVNEVFNVYFSHLHNCLLMPNTNKKHTGMLFGCLFLSHILCPVAVGQGWDRGPGPPPPTMAWSLV